MEYISRYNNFIIRNELKTLPLVGIIEQETDIFENYIIGVTRFDKLSKKYYGNATFGWLISYANNKYKSEFEYNDNDIIRIPFPLDNALQNYFEQTKREINL